MSSYASAATLEMVIFSIAAITVMIVSFYEVILTWLIGLPVMIWMLCLAFGTDASVAGPWFGFFVIMFLVWLCIFVPKFLSKRRVIKADNAARNSHH